MGGDILLPGSINVNQGMKKHPLFLPRKTRKKNGNALKSIVMIKERIEISRNEDIIQSGRNEYVYKSNTNNVFFLASKINKCMLHNDELLYKNISVGRQINQRCSDISIRRAKCVFVINMACHQDLPAKMITGFWWRRIPDYYKLFHRFHIEAF